MHSTVAANCLLHARTHTDAGAGLQQAPALVPKSNSRALRSEAAVDSRSTARLTEGCSALVLLDSNAASFASAPVTKR